MQLIHGMYGKFKSDVSVQGVTSFAGAEGRQMVRRRYDVMHHGSYKRRRLLESQSGWYCVKGYHDEVMSRMQGSTRIAEGVRGHDEKQASSHPFAHHRSPLPGPLPLSFGIGTRSQVASYRRAAAVHQEERARGPKAEIVSTSRERRLTGHDTLVITLRSPRSISFHVPTNLLTLLFNLSTPFKLFLFSFSRSSSISVGELKFPLNRDP